MDQQELLERLKQDIDVASWELLGPHVERNAVFVIDPELQLEHVGLAIARDDIESVKHWQNEKMIRGPQQDEIDRWSENPTKNSVEFLIIQPYVLVKELVLSA